MPFRDTAVPTVQQFTDQFLEHLRLDRGVDLAHANERDKYAALSHTVRDRLMAG